MHRNSLRGHVHDAVPLGLAIAAFSLTLGLSGFGPVLGDIPTSSTSVTCTPSSVAVYAATICTAVVSIPAQVQGGIASSVLDGMFVWSSSGVATFAPTESNATGPYPQTCMANPQTGACTVTVVPLTYSTTPITITAAYGNDPDHGTSYGTYQLSLGPAQTPPSNVAVVTATTTVTATATTGASVSFFDAAGLVVVVAVLMMILTFEIGEWRRGTPHPTAKPASPNPTP